MSRRNFYVVVFLCRVEKTPRFHSAFILTLSILVDQSEGHCFHRERGTANIIGSSEALVRLSFSLDVTRVCLDEIRDIEISLN